MQEAAVVLSILRERGRKGLPLTQLYRQMSSKNRYLLAYGTLLQPGAMTPGQRKPPTAWKPGCSGRARRTW